MSAVLPEQQRFINLIREWTHFDNLVENHTAQATNAKTMRTKTEQQVIQLMNELHIEKSVIQVSGARLSLQKDARDLPILWEFLEKELSTFFKKDKVVVASLLKWLRERDHQSQGQIILKKMI